MRNLFGTYNALSSRNQGEIVFAKEDSKIFFFKYEKFGKWEVIWNMDGFIEDRTGILQNPQQSLNAFHGFIPPSFSPQIESRSCWTLLIELALEPAFSVFAHREVYVMVFVYKKCVCVYKLDLYNLFAVFFFQISLISPGDQWI